MQTHTIDYTEIYNLLNLYLPKFYAELTLKKLGMVKNKKNILKMNNIKLKRVNPENNIEIIQAMVEIAKDYKAKKETLQKIITNN